MKSTMERVQEHYQEALQYFPENRIVGLFLQGSQNYGLEIPNSDVDTKLIVVPSFEEIVFNRKPKSTTHIRENNEHIDFKDIRLYMQTFRKQNLNFLEILFTEYAIINPLYKKDWDRLIQAREAITHYNKYAAVTAMRGIALEKYHAMEHRYPSKIEILDKMGYDPKQLHHLVRIREYLERYINNEPYENCLKPHNPEYLKDIKLGKYNLDEARVLADKALKEIQKISAPFTKDSKWNTNDLEVENLLNEVQYNIILTATQIEILKG